MEHQQAYGDIHRIQRSAAWEDSTAVEDEQPTAGGKRRRVDTVLRMDRARVLICDPIPAEAVERISSGRTPGAREDRPLAWGDRSPDRPLRRRCRPLCHEARGAADRGPGDLLFLALSANNVSGQFPTFKRGQNSLIGTGRPHPQIPNKSIFLLFRCITAGPLATPCGKVIVCDHCDKGTSNELVNKVLIL